MNLQKAGYGIEQRQFNMAGAKPPNIERPRTVDALAPGYERLHREAVARIRKLTPEDLDQKIQVPGASPWFGRHVTYEQDGFVPRWRGIYDDHGRIMVAICHNMDLGDSWEHADNPDYPQEFSALGIRIGINYVVYSMSH